MKPREGVYYAAWMFGIIVTVPLCRLMGMHHILGLVVGVVVGIGFGIVAEKVFDQFFGNQQRPGNPKDQFMSGGKFDSAEDHERGCPNLSCNWYGDVRKYINCPKCNERLDNPYRTPRS